MAANGSEFVTLSQLKISIDSIDISSSSIDAYPVGSIYMSVNSTSPASLFGGTWQQIKDQFLMCAGSKYKAGGTGGEATHTLTVDEMPSHRHRVKSDENSVSANQSYWIASNGSSNSNHPRYEATHSIDFAGGGQPHNNMPPYLAVYAWKRTK